MTRRRTTGLSTALGTLLVLTACGAGPKAVPPPAPHPTTAPAVVAPAGTSVKVGDQPGSIVYDQSTNTLAVVVRNPDRLQLLDATTLELKKSVRLPGGVNHLQLARPGGPVLVPVASADRLLEVALPSGRIRSVGLPGRPDDAAAAANGEVAVVSTASGSLSIVRGGTVLHTFTDLKRPTSVTAYGNTIAVLDASDSTLSTYDLTTLRRTDRIPFGSTPTQSVLISGQRLVAAGSGADRLLVSLLDPPQQVASVSLPGAPAALASDQTTDTVWVTLPQRNEVVGLDVSADTPSVIATYTTTRQPSGVAVAPGADTIWVTGRHDGVVQRIFH